jgi:hypothetical protein
MAIRRGREGGRKAWQPVSRFPAFSHPQETGAYTWAACGWGWAMHSHI